MAEAAGPAGSAGAGVAGALAAGPAAPAPVPAPIALPPGFPPEWRPAGFGLLCRTVTAPLPEGFPGVIAPAMGAILADLRPPFREGEAPAAGDLLFFDLETTGLSGGAGTVAFLAATGRVQPGGGGLEVTQRLLLDYPGEPALLDLLLEDLRPRGGGGAAPHLPLLVTYNGKAFDAQILRTRCLMNGLALPPFRHCDLLHPARRFWKHILPECSLGAVETLLPGLDRGGDLPGALAPEMWFAFLKTACASGLLKVCEHNLRDILGLAALFAAFSRAAEDPLDAVSRYRCGPEALGLSLRRFFQKENADLWGAGHLAQAAGRLLDIAAEEGSPLASFLRAKDLLEGPCAPEGRRRLRALAEAPQCPARLRAAALRALALDAEWRLGVPAEAAAYVRSALAVAPLGESLRADLESRLPRLERKLRKQAPPANPLW